MPNIARIAPVLAGTLSAVACVLTGLAATGALAGQPAVDGAAQPGPTPAPTSGPPSGPVTGPAADATAAPPLAQPPAPPAPPAAPSAPPVDPVALATAQASLDAGAAAYTNGQASAARDALAAAWQDAPAGAEGDRIAIEAARRLGFIALESRDPRQAEAWFAAETVLARRLFFARQASPRRLSEAVSRWASAAGAMGRSTESAALVFYAREIRRRDQAAVSSEILKRDATFEADTQPGVTIDAGDLCVTGRDAIVSKRVSCQQESAARIEALELQARQIAADAPPPPTKAEREAKAKERKAKGER